MVDSSPEISNSTVQTPPTSIENQSEIQLPKKNKKWIGFVIALAIGCLVLLSVSAFFLVGRSNDKNDSPDQDLQPTITTTPDTNDEVTSSPEVSPEAEEEIITPTEELINETEMGFITKVFTENGKNYLEIDYVQWVTDEAVCRAKVGEIENGYCIINENSKLRVFEISSAVVIDVSTYSHAASGDFNWEEKIDLATFNSFFEKNAETHLNESPYIITVKESKVISISEQYRP